MKVILTQDVKNLGTQGDIKNVADGFVRNYLLPRELVVEATPSNMNIWESQKKAREKKKDLENKTLKEVAEKLAAYTCTIEVKTGEDKKMFGSVTALMIAEKLAEAGFTIDKKNIVMHESIKDLGTHAVAIRLSPQIHTQVIVCVVNQP